MEVDANTTCHYCGHKGHLESVCQDKFLGLEQGRGKKQPCRQQISASTGDTPFTLFPGEKVQVASSTSSTSAHTTAPASPAAPDLSTQISQLQELLNRTNAMTPAPHFL